MSSAKQGAERPAEIIGYVGKCCFNGMGCDRVVGSNWELVDWQGKRIGWVRQGSSWRVRSHLGSRMYQFYATIGGREYTGRGFGEGMSVRLRETAESKRRSAKA